MTVKLIPQTADENCNAYLIGENDNYILIDAPNNAIVPVKNIDGKLRAIILTHGHFDHISGLREIAEVSGAQVYIHEAEIPMLTDTRMNLADMFFDSGTFPVYDGKVKGLADGEVLNISGLSCRIFHAPGHTPGLIAVQIKDCIFTGDFIFEGSIGNTSFPNSKAIDMDSSLRRFAGTFHDTDYILYPGHGNKTSMFKEMMHNPFL
ncbi:MAG: MBL fold metallo-hydrolase [Ruminococcus sp.]|jgi:glyoxylase-like metal-dependent hydrolase (beta-lactamase superfamily II)|nr:MBL fold metallo-hydrolase [Ruminococcus sp.]